jgi:hypothetical protein
VRDWNASVRERLGGISLGPRQQDEIVAEIASHLEESFEKHRAQGLSESQAVQHAFAEVENWSQLTAKICRAKHEEGNMNERTRQFWLPSLVSLTLSMVWLMTLQLAGAQPGLYRLGSLHLAIYIPWFISLPFFGAAAAYLSRRAGGDRLTRISASLFPAFAILAAIILFIVPDILIFHEAAPSNAFVRAHFGISTVIGVFYLVVLPAIPLLLGALPFLKHRTSLNPS